VVGDERVLESGVMYSARWRVVRWVSTIFSMTFSGFTGVRGALIGLVCGTCVMHVAFLCAEFPGRFVNGTDVPLGLSSAPLSIVFFEPLLLLYVGAVVWMVLGFVASVRWGWVTKFGFPVLAITHYLSAGAFARWGEHADWDRFWRTWLHIAPGLLWAWLVAYVTAHLLLWLVYFLGEPPKSRRKVPALTPTFGALIGLLYGLFLVYFALLCAGFGEGTPIPLGFVSAPLSIVYFGLYLEVAGLFLWMIMGFLAGHSRRVVRRYGFPMLAITHYLTASAFARWGQEADWDRFRVLWHSGARGFLTTWFAVYVGGHLLLWGICCFPRKDDLS
jgi:hypothetical protein